MNVDEQTKRWAIYQGAYDLIGGAWPLISMRSFEAVTGPKIDEWLVRTVAGILVWMGVVLIHAALVKRHVDRGVRVMAFGISIVLTLVSVISALNGRISSLYLLDGVFHGALGVGWLVLWHRAVRERRMVHGSGNTLHGQPRSSARS